MPADPTIQDGLDAVKQRGRVSGTGILCAPPTTDTTDPYMVIEGGLVLREGLGNDSYGSVLSFVWDLDGDSTFETVGQNVFFSAVGMSGPARQTVSLQVCNTQQLCATAQTEVTICLVPWYSGTVSVKQKEQLWDRYYQRGTDRQRRSRPIWNFPQRAGHAPGYLD